MKWRLREVNANTGKPLNHWRKLNLNYADGSSWVDSPEKATLFDHPHDAIREIQRCAVAMCLKAKRAEDKGEDAAFHAFVASTVTLEPVREE